MSHQCYFVEEENAKEESIDNYIDLFCEYKDNPPNLREALNQLFISGGVPENLLNENIEDIFSKVNSVLIDNNERKQKIKEKYPTLSIEDAQIITSYTCEAKRHIYSPYFILNKRLVDDDREQGIKNVSKYFYILLMALRKLSRYYPDKQLYRCIKKKVTLYDPSNKKYIPYEIGKEKTFWAFTSTSLNCRSSYKFLGKNNDVDDTEYKSGTIFSLSGNIWGYDITVLSYFPEEGEILLEPERKYIIKEVMPELNEIITIRGEFKETSIVLKDILKNNKIIVNTKNYSNNIFDFMIKGMKIGFTPNTENPLFTFLMKDVCMHSSIFFELESPQKKNETGILFMYGCYQFTDNEMEIKRFFLNKKKMYFPYEEKGGLNFGEIDEQKYNENFCKKGIINLIFNKKSNKMTLKHFIENIKKMNDPWTASNYNVFTHNQHDFVKEAIKIINPGVSKESINSKELTIPSKINEELKKRII